MSRDRFIAAAPEEIFVVTEQWDARQVRGKVFLRLAGYLGRHPANIERTLERLDAYVTGSRAAG